MMEGDDGDPNFVLGPSNTEKKEKEKDKEIAKWPLEDSARYIGLKYTKITRHKRLNASNKQLIELPPYISELTQVRHLNLSNNQLEELPDKISNLTNLGSAEKVFCPH